MQFTFDLRLIHVQFVFDSGSIPVRFDLKTFDSCLRSKTNLGWPCWKSIVEYSATFIFASLESPTMKKAWSRTTNFFFRYDIGEMALDWLCVKILAFDWLREMFDITCNFRHVTSKFYWLPLIFWIHTWYIGTKTFWRHLNELFGLVYPIANGYTWYSNVHLW